MKWDLIVFVFLGFVFLYMTLFFPVRNIYITRFKKLYKIYWWLQLIFQGAAIFVGTILIFIDKKFMAVSLIGVVFFAGGIIIGCTIIGRIKYLKKLESIIIENNLLELDVKEIKKLILSGAPSNNNASTMGLLLTKIIKLFKGDD